MAPKLHLKDYKKSDKYQEKDSNLEKISAEQFYVHWNLGQFKNMYINNKEKADYLNFKKAIVGLFQYQLLDGGYVETDVSGTCDATYTTISSTRYHKGKRNCKVEGQLEHERFEEVLGTAVQITRDAELFIRPSGDLERIESQEYLKYSVNSYDKAGGFYDSLMILKAEGEEESVDILTGNTIEEAVGQLNLAKEPFLPSERTSSSDDSLVKLVKEYKKDLAAEQIGKVPSALALLRLVSIARVTKADDFVRIWNARSMQELRGQLCDLMGAIQTDEAHKAAKSVMDFRSEKDFEATERYMQALAVGTRPGNAIILDLLHTLEDDKEFESEKSRDSMMQTLASMTYRFAKLPGNCFNHETVQKVSAFLTKKLEKCKKDNCKLIYTQAMQNLRDPKTVDVLVLNALAGSYDVSVASMKALRSFPISIWNEQYKNKFADIFYETNKKYDSSSRVLALDILLDMGPSFEELKALVHYLQSPSKTFEVKQYLLQRLRMFSEKCPKFKESFTAILKSDPKLNNYHVIGVRGLSTALERKFSGYPSFNGSVVSLQELKSGVLKRGSVDLTMEVQDKKMSLLTLGLYAGGLSSFVSSNEEVDPEESSTPTAGMELTIQGSYLRPLQFFRGQGELMGHVWSGTASDPTPAYQATTLLHDTEKSIAMTNGVTLDLAVLGAMSIDLNGQVTFSLWNRNAQSKVEQK
jgi:microsomal triglyceride transfer protein large subunit